ncbi:helix-turn-helix domain-containing protein [Nonomuraea sp. NPDC050153]|uniref:helix-turn-helix domain-containing protein n=1 Tax=Nonomuraea sp. NPDC050153 TaxID=3364359 RepID=UPI0037B072BC
MEEIKPSQTMTAMQAVSCLCRSRPFMTVEAAALILDMSVDYLHVGIREGRIPAHRFGRSYRLRRDFIYGFVTTPSGARFEDYAATWLAKYGAEATA